MLAARVLKDPYASDLEKSLAGSVLSQYGTDNQTGADLQTLASAALKDPASSERIKKLAGSVVSQSTTDR
ncbi:hypothetical protein [Rouxiella chamberiensis]